MDSYELHARTARTLRNLYQQKHCQPGFKGTEIGSKEGRMILRAKPQMQGLVGLPWTQKAQAQGSGTSSPEFQKAEHLCGFRGWSCHPSKRWSCHPSGPRGQSNDPRKIIFKP